MIRGIHEESLVAALERYFTKKGYEVHPHAQLNIAWGNLISDVDVLAIKKNEVIAVEVKSKKDVFSRAFTQLAKIAPFVDKVYIATDDEVKANEFRNGESVYGILYIDLTYNEITVKKSAKTCKKIIPSAETLCYLKRCCLEELAEKAGVASKQSKPFLAIGISRSVKPSKLKRMLADVAVYQRHTHKHVT